MMITKEELYARLNEGREVMNQDITVYLKLSMEASSRNGVLAAQPLAHPRRELLHS
jgi:hypothetical protein